MSEAAIREGRETNARLREAYFNAQNERQGRPGDGAPEPAVRQRWLARLLDWITRSLSGYAGTK